MSDSNNYRELLLAYLLDELPAAERARVDHQMLVDDEYSAALKEAEYDLLDAYVAGELAGAERDRVYKAIVSARELAVGAEMAGALQRKLAAESGEPKTAAKTVKMQRRPAWQWPLAIAAAIAVVAVGATMTVEYLARHSAAAGMASQGTKQPDRALAGNSGAPSAAPALAEKSPPGHAALAKHLAVEAESITLVLPETARGTSAVAARLLPQTRFLRVQWPGASALPPGAAGSLKLEIADDRRIVLTALARPQNGHSAAEFRVPVRSLTPGSYLFRVVGPGAPAGSAPPEVYSENSVTLSR